MKIFKIVFHFLGGIQFAIILIALAAFTVILGTFLESKTQSHLLAARWTYEHPLFLILLCCFFINILFSALRRWPFKKKHFPFLITHLGLLMMIGGTILKNRWGLQGQMAVWEGSGNQHVSIPHTYALLIECQDKSSLIPLDSLDPAIYYPYHFPELKCKILGFTPHVRENMEMWIKGPMAYLAGYPPIEVKDWTPSELLPKGISHSHLPDNSPEKSWSVFALRTTDITQALKEAYLQGLILKIRSKENPSAVMEIPLTKALEEPFLFNSCQLTAELNLSFPIFENQELSSFILHCKSQNSNQVEHLTVFLQGQDALLVKSDPLNWMEASFTIDLIRSQPNLLIVDSEDGSNILFAFDSYGRIYGKTVHFSNLQTLISYNQGFDGYGVQEMIPYPSFPSSREDKELAAAYELTQQLKQALSQKPALAPPLQFFEQACEKAKVDFPETFVNFMTAWNATSGFLFLPKTRLSDSLEAILQNLNWNSISPHDFKSVQWTCRLLEQLEFSLKQGEKPLTVLEKNHWPFLSEMIQAAQKPQKNSPVNVFAQQIFSIADYLPPLNLPSSFSTQENAQFLSAYFRSYGIDYRSLCPFQDQKIENFEGLADYWKDHASSDSRFEKILETPLTHRILPEDPPLKLEDCCPGIILEVQHGQKKQTIALAYDVSGAGLKWPILNGIYTIRFQPKLVELPYRVRLRQARQISYPQSLQIYSYECDVLISEGKEEPKAQTLSMNHVYETWDGYRFYLSGVGQSDAGLRRIQLAINHDPAKYILTYPGAILVFIGTVLLLWILPYSKK